MTNAQKFQETFGIYATEMWAMPEHDFLKWLNADTSQTEETCERCVYVRGSQWCQGCNGTPKRWDGEKIADTPQTDMDEDIVRSYGFKVESYRQAKAKDEPQTDCGWK